MWCSLSDVLVVHNLAAKNRQEQDNDRKMRLSLKSPCASF